MNSPQPEQEFERYRILLIVPQANQALVERVDSQIRLPWIEVPRYSRPAQQITIGVFERWSLRSIVIEWLLEQEGASPCAILEVLYLDPSILPKGLFQLPLDVLPDGILTKDIRSTVHRLLVGDTEGHGPLSRFGWINDAIQWIRKSAHDEALDITDIRQFNAGGSFVLARFGTRFDQTYWLKAVGEPNTREFATTAFLAEHCARYLPTIIGMKRDWNAWVMKEFGASLHSSCSLSDFVLAAARLGELQMQLTGKTAELLAAHFVDHRIATLRSHIDGLIEHLDDAMRHQTSTKVQPLSTPRLHEIGIALHKACGIMQALDIPDSVLHGDISPGSILSDGINCVFTDWCEAYVGNPFITFEQFSVHVSRIADEPGQWIQALKNAYTTCWADVLSKRQLETGLQLVPLISLLSYLYGRGDWLNSARRRDPAFQSYSRSLARHMDRASAQPELLEALCHPN